MNRLVETESSILKCVGSLHFLFDPSVFKIILIMY